LSLLSLRPNTSIFWVGKLGDERRYLNTFTSQELHAATENFAEHRRIGEGGFGAVYSGKLRGVGIAVKRLNQDGLQGEAEMLRELQVLGSMQHRHLVGLLGWCQAEHCLVYELAERGSLEVSASTSLCTL
jgi:serine/threonine protein kinase